LIDKAWVAGRHLAGPTCHLRAAYRYDAPGGALKRSVTGSMKRPATR